MTKQDCTTSNKVTFIEEPTAQLFEDFSVPEFAKGNIVYNELKKVEMIARVCYKSEASAMDLSDEDSLKNSPEAVFTAQISLTEMMGSEIYLYMEGNGQKMLARIPSHFDFKTGETVRLAIDMTKIHVFDKETQKIICRS